MIDTTFEIDGRKVNPSEIGDALERVVYKQVRDEIMRKIADVRDPKTGQPPKITVKGHSLQDLQIEVSGSEALVTEVKRRLG